MTRIEGHTRSVDELLRNEKFSIGYFQREYNWKEKNIRELMKDLSSKFFKNYKKSDEYEDISGYENYYLGPIIVSENNNTKVIIDGQQRLTSLTLMLIHIRHKIDDEEKETLHDLISSGRRMRRGKKSFNLDVEERNDCMDALFNGNEFEEKNQPESVVNILRRYKDIQKYFDPRLKGETLIYFTDWLCRNVHLVEIVANSEVDAYTIFVTMNDRGLPLTPIDKLKGYFLSKIKNDERRNDIGKLWQDQMLALKREGDHIRVVRKEIDSFIKSWLISQYAEKFSKDESVEVLFGLDVFRDFDFLYENQGDDVHNINVDPYRWVSENHKKRLKLTSSKSCELLIKDNFVFYSDWYRHIRDDSGELTKYLRIINKQEHFGRYTRVVPYVLFLAPLCSGEDREESQRKIRVVAKYIDILLSRQSWNMKANNNSITYDEITQYVTPQLIKEVRRKSSSELAEILIRHLVTDKDPFDSNCMLKRGGSDNSILIRRLLARITEFVEINTERESHYEEYINSVNSNLKYDIEHILPKEPKEDEGEFKNRVKQRDLIGGLLLVPMSPNRSFKGKSYTEKRNLYLKENILAQSLHEDTYKNDPRIDRFKDKFKTETGLELRDHAKFREADLDARQELYRAIAKKIWDPETLRLELEN